MAWPRCSYTGCKHEATHIPKLCVPAKGWPSNYNPLSVVFDTPCCREHVMRFPLMDEQTPELRRVFEVLARGKALPDFARSYVEPLRLGTPEADKALAALRSGR